MFIVVCISVLSLCHSKCCLSVCCSFCCGSVQSNILFVSVIGNMAQCETKIGH